MLQTARFVILLVMQGSQGKGLQQHTTASHRRLCPTMSSWLTPKCQADMKNWKGRERRGSRDLSIVLLRRAVISLVRIKTGCRLFSIP